METFRNLGLPVDTVYQDIKMAAQLFIVGVGIFGNIYTVYCVITKSKLQRITNFFIIVISLALMLQSLNACIDLTNHWANEEYYVLSPIWCEIWNSMNVFLPSMFALLCFFAVSDRYIYLEHPGVYDKVMNVTTVVPMVTVSFVYPAVVTFVPIYLDWHTDEPFMPEGECKFKITVKYALISPLFTFWLPMIMVITIIVKLFKAMERHDQALALLMIERDCPMSKAVEAARESATHGLPWGEDQIRREQRLAITLWSVYWNISIFWIPQHVWIVVYKVTGANWPRATNFIPWFGYLPSAILPGLLYYYDIYDI